MRNNIVTWDKPKSTINTTVNSFEVRKKSRRIYGVELIHFSFNFNSITIPLSWIN